MYHHQRTHGTSRTRSSYPATSTFFLSDRPSFFIRQPLTFQGTTEERHTLAQKLAVGTIATAAKNPTHTCPHLYSPPTPIRLMKIYWIKSRRILKQLETYILKRKAYFESFFCRGTCHPLFFFSAGNQGTKNDSLRIGKRDKTLSRKNSPFVVFSASPPPVWLLWPNLIGQQLGVYVAVPSNY